MDTNVISDAQGLEDARLVELVLGGQREAFGQLVARYQSPICALAYSGCGNISQSEDLAQEVFIVAWRKLRDLKEPAKFKSWLYGIARNLINNSHRQQLRNPLAAADPLDEGFAAGAAISSPTEHAMTREEEGILWRSLEQIPETYREPLVLFYREQQSIERVAEVMELSEEAVRQRMSRGRKLLQEQVIAFVEGALAHSGPNQAFTVGVMSALPALSLTASSSAVGGAMLKGGVGGKAVLASLLVPFAPILPAAVGAWVGSKIPASPNEKKFAVKAWGLLFLVNILIIVGANWAPHDLGIQYLRTHPRVLAYVHFGAALLYFALLFIYVGWMVRGQYRIQKEEAKKPENACLAMMLQPFEYRSSKSFLGLPMVHVRLNCRKNGKILPAKGWIAVGEISYGIIFSCGAIAVGGVSWGALAIGVVGLGGVGIGGLAFGGLAVGIAAFGGGSVGYMAYGGTAIAWLAGAGGDVFSHHFGTGGSVIAEHANDAAARSFMRNSFFFRHVLDVMGPMIALSFVLPPMLTLWGKRKLMRRSAAAQLVK
jgi:RNA polymerase sigma factor (sigma-70 family)